ncbi:MAG: glycosyltransferase family 2 protein [Xanthobacteraceae bacterium]|nr:glycosyltransferase family 2 protein [Xanthobacteraceae bacterium]
MPENMQTVSVIIPAYNEADSILKVLQAVDGQRNHGISLEIIVVDDGSNDRTVEIVKSCPHLYSKLIELSPNGGKGKAVKAGLEQATGDYILIQDADLEYDPADYPLLFSPVLKRDADVVIGSRLVAPPLIRVYYFWHKVGNRAITLLFNIMFNTTFTDIYCGYLLYRRSLLHPTELKTVGWEQHAEMLSRLVSRAPVIYEVPISYFGRTYSEGKKIRARHIVPVLWQIVVRRFAR